MDISQDPTAFSDDKQELLINLESPLTSTPTVVSTPAALVWKDIVCAAAQREAPILNKVSGHAKPGEILAIMGPSGCGKTTLLNILAGRLTSTRGFAVQGTIEVNNESISRIDYSRIAAFIPQSDILLAEFTPRECFQFSLDMRTRLPAGTKRKRVEKMLSVLKLDHVADNRIGDHLNRGISGGERKRVCIGVELIIKPPILFLDEPTSGLDSVTAEVVISTLAKQAEQGTNIILTIHQPSSTLYGMLDMLILMSRGNFVYHGPAHEAADHFSRIGYECPTLVNPPEFFMGFLHVKDQQQLTEEEDVRLQHLTSHFKVHEIPELHDSISLSKMGADTKPAALSRFFYVLVRACKSSLRNREHLKSQLAQNVIITLLLIAVFNDLGEGLGSFQNRSGFVFFLSNDALLMTNQHAAIPCKPYIVPKDRAVFLKEYKQGMYGALEFLIGKTIIGFCQDVILGTVQALVLYWTIGLNDQTSEKFMYFCKYTT